MLAGDTETVGLMTCLTICRKDLFAPIARRKFRDLLCALGSGSFFHRLWLAAVRVERIAAKISRVTTEVGAAGKHRRPINREQPNRKRFASAARFALSALNAGAAWMPVWAFAAAAGDGEARGAFGAGPAGAFGGGELGEAPGDVAGEPAGRLGDAAGLAFATAEGDAEAGGAFGLGAADGLGAGEAEGAAGDPAAAGGEPAGGGEAADGAGEAAGEPPGGGDAAALGAGAPGGGEPAFAGGFGLAPDGAALGVGAPPCGAGEATGLAAPAGGALCSSAGARAPMFERSWP